MNFCQFCFATLPQKFTKSFSELINNKTFKFTDESEACVYCYDLLNESTLFEVINEDDHFKIIGLANAFEIACSNVLPEALSTEFKTQVVLEIILPSQLKELHVSLKDAASVNNIDLPFNLPQVLRAELSRTLELRAVDTDKLVDLQNLLDNSRNSNQCYFTISLEFIPHYEGDEPIKKCHPRKKRKSSRPIQRTCQFGSAPFQWLVHFKWRSTPILYSGCYVKLNRALAQTSWLLSGATGSDGQSSGFPSSSIEEMVGEILNQHHASSSETLIGCGREDVDVRMLGSGREMLIIVKNLRRFTPPITIDKVLERLNPSVLRLPSFSFTSLSSSFISQHTKDFHELENRKTYGMVVMFNRPLLIPINNSQLFRLAVRCYEPTEGSMVDSLAGKAFSINQLTPVRVLHRRAMITRSRKLWKLDLEGLSSSKLMYCCRLETDPGTYVKEFCHGDFGRTKPSLSDLIMRFEEDECGQSIPLACDILQLDVLSITRT